MSPQLRLICAQGRDYTYIYIMQARFHRNIAASSLAADCNVPQRPPAIIRSFTSIQMVHTHTSIRAMYDIASYQAMLDHTTALHHGVYSASALHYEISRLGHYLHCTAAHWTLFHFTGLRCITLHHLLWRCNMRDISLSCGALN